jgi:hypothetical protein
MALLSAVLMIVAAPSAAAPAQPDALARARLFYNQQQYDQAIASAEKAVGIPALADSARLVIGRSYLERFRQSANAADLDAGRAALRGVQAAMLPPRDQAQLLIGLGEALYLDNWFGPAAGIFSSVLGASTPADLRDTVLDWWATSLDRLAQDRPPDDREEVYTQIVGRMEDELARDASSTSAAYWLAAASRGAGDLDRAWYAAVAGWVRALLSPRRGAALRADLDQLVQTAIIPERARTLGPDRDRAIAELQKEWEQVKANWK